MLLGTPPNGGDLPLLIVSDQGSWELLALFADPNRDARELLINEPGLACWVFLSAPPESIRTLVQGEHWLKTEGLQHWSQLKDAQSTLDEQSTRVAIVDRLTRCTAATRQYVASVGADHESVWNSLLYWIVENGATPSLTSAGASPDWLTEWAKQNPQEDLTSDGEAVSRWRSESWQPNQSADSICNALRRSSTLEADFANQLEIEKLASLRQLAYGASHEVNNPLANISTRAQTLLIEETDPDRSRALTVMYEQAMRAHEMIANMMVYAHPPEPHCASYDLRESAPILIAELAALAERQRVQLIENRPAEPQLANVDRVQIAMTLKALLQNAIENSPLGGEVTISYDTSDCSRRRISVSDAGPGVAPELRRHIFDPFFSGREAGRGLGFGLSTARRLIEQNGGEIELETSATGSRFTISLPAAS